MKIVVLGAGISGLATAWWLVKEGLDVTILEKNPEPGGSMISRSEEGFLVDYGPNSGLETTPVISQLAEETGIKGEMIYANEASANRYILKNGILHVLPTGPSAFLKTRLFSGMAKLRLFAEPFIGRSRDGYYQSISEFVKRRLGKEFLDYAIDPFVSGVFAGNPDKLSVKSAFPKLYRLEELYGGLIKGMVRGAKERKRNPEKAKNTARMFSFKQGIQTLPAAIAHRLKDNIIYDCQINGIKRSSDGYQISYDRSGSQENTNADILVSALPAWELAAIMKDYDPELSGHLQSIYYPPVKVLYLGYRREDIERELDGFGFLIPSKEKKLFLGAIWSSVIFPERAPEGCASFTLFIGGARSPEMTAVDSEIINELVIDEFSSIMGINKPPVFIREKLWDKAIPQYNTGYIEHENYFDEFEKKNAGFILTGNYRGGISVGDCVKNSVETGRKIINIKGSKNVTHKQ